MTESVLSEQLRMLKLHTAAAELAEVLGHHKKAVSLEWLTELLSRELDSRKEKALGQRIKNARFPEETSLEGFDWGFNPDIDRQRIEELAGLEFVRQKGIALFLGKPGTGKTHLATAIGVKAVYSGYRVYCTSLKKLVQDIQVARIKGTLDVLFKRVLSAQLWILDDWGVVTMPREAAEEVFDLLDRRKRNSALLLTSNRDVDEWAQLFPEPVLANATIDRLFEQAQTVLFTGDSYRLKGRIRITQHESEKAWDVQR